jgi:hypothetical protein
MVAGCHPFFFQSTGFTSSTIPIQLDFSQNQTAAITLNTGSPQTLICRCYDTARQFSIFGLSVTTPIRSRFPSNLGSRFLPRLLYLQLSLYGVRRGEDTCGMSGAAAIYSSYAEFKNED